MAIGAIVREKFTQMVCLLDESQSFFFSSLSQHFSGLLFAQEEVIHNAFLIDFLDGGVIFTLDVVMAQSTCCSSGVDEIHVKSLQMDGNSDWELRSVNSDLELGNINCVPLELMVETVLPMSSSWSSKKMWVMVSWNESVNATMNAMASTFEDINVEIIIRLVGVIVTNEDGHMETWICLVDVTSVGLERSQFLVCCFFVFSGVLSSECLAAFMDSAITFCSVQSWLRH